ncbi:hypothetical protein OPT61_g9008 [Boeremia exigua]|uniref:Uncharacterized protein n=1 Tax=Boeremia exigua TaxID=749465 RepID=A0ACC2HW96_9PLEO|nr:hypothetical protein OPT61_g9008 [Boeremia exigua]
MYLNVDEETPPPTNKRKWQDVDTVDKEHKDTPYWLAVWRTGGIMATFTDTVAELTPCHSVNTYGHYLVLAYLGNVTAH